MKYHTKYRTEMDVPGYSNLLGGTREDVLDALAGMVITELARRRDIEYVKFFNRFNGEYNYRTFQTQMKVGQLCRFEIYLFEDRALYLKTDDHYKIHHRDYEDHRPYPIPDWGRYEVRNAEINGIHMRIREFLEAKS